MYGLTPRQFWRFWWRYLAGIAMWIALAYFAWNAPAAWSAHLGHGRVGTWSVIRITCNTHGCFPIGKFVSDDGTDVRIDVQMSEAPSPLYLGSHARAVDTNADEVFPVGGGNAWIKLTAATAITSVICVAWIWTVPVAAIRRRRKGDLRT